MLLKPLSLAAVLLLFAGVLNAQSDSTTFNAGTLHLSRQFTQNITIKGEDLERFPFSSLEEAINVYFNGAYTDAQNVLYVIDGNTGADVNAYSIHDIESITLLQDARAIVGGIHRAQKLVIIKTRTRMTRSTGFTAAASSYLTKRKDQDNINFYHQLFTSGRYYRRNLEIGASLSYLHEAYPIEISDKTIHADPQKLNRFTANAWLTSTLGRSVLNVRFNASPQQSGMGRSYQAFSDVTANEHSDSKKLQLYPTASLFTRFSDRFYNQLDGGYVKKNVRSYSEQLVSYDNGYENKSLANDRNQHYQLFLREEFGYIHKVGRWSFNPAINIYGLHQKDKITSNTFSISNSPGGVAASMSESNIKERGIVFTPVINITNNLNFNFQGGVQYNRIKRMSIQADKRIHPFASVSVDMIKIIRTDAPASLMLHASYAEAKSDLLNFFQPSSYFYWWNNGQIEPVLITPSYGTLHKPHHVTAGGLTLSFMEDRLKFLYTREHKSYYIDSYISTAPATGYNFVISAAKIKLHADRFGVQYQTAEGKIFQFSSLLGIYHMQSVIEFENPNVLVSPVNSQQFFPQPGWSGGLTNQLSYKRFTAGVSCLYYFDEHKWASENSSGFPPTLQKLNSIVLQHIYAGYKFKHLELYVSGRNILRHDESASVNGEISYFGAGVKSNL